MRIVHWIHMTDLRSSVSFHLSFQHLLMHVWAFNYKNIMMDEGEFTLKVIRIGVEIQGRCFVKSVEPHSYVSHGENEFDIICDSCDVFCLWKENCNRQNRRTSAIGEY